MASFFTGLSSLIVLVALLISRSLSATDTGECQFAPTIYEVGVASVSAILLWSLVTAFHFPVLSMILYKLPACSEDEKPRQKRLVAFCSSFTIPLSFWTIMVFSEFFPMPKEFTISGDILNMARLVSLSGCHVYGGFIGISWASVLEVLKCEVVSTSFKKVTDPYAIYLFGAFFAAVTQHYYIVRLISWQTCLVGILCLPVLYFFYPDRVKSLWERPQKEITSTLLPFLAASGVLFWIASWFISSMPYTGILQIVWLVTWAAIALMIPEFGNWRFYLRRFCEETRYGSTCHVHRDRSTFVALHTIKYIKVIIFHMAWAVLLCF